ncbi:hypothetical protein GDO78_021397 [Eleutherodactylus coqui]|uniref:Uncharacterized protein n=1 Tax=Eleutherodactylus coqui TaxID=57060 RepID=A0A8J6B2X5_ELECQ|nr:hypothetical protein GDO78_021397 [Eleutherodactylus coqui]
MSCSAISRELTEPSGTPVPPSTVGRSLARSGLHGRSVADVENKARRPNYGMVVSVRRRQRGMGLLGYSKSWGSGRNYWCPHC